MTSHSASHPPLEPHARFEMLTRLNAPERAITRGISGRVDERLSRVFDGDSLVERFVRALADRRSIRTKELFESLEVFERARRVLRGKDVVDLCCGHGLVGLCFAVFERDVERVWLLDQAQPASFQTCLDAVLSVAPWAADKVTFRTGRLQNAEDWVPQGAGIVAVHACGPRSDRVLDLALSRAARGLVLVPCCYPDADLPGAPPVTRLRFGASVAADTHRTYRLTSAGFTVRWGAIPPEITPMNRVVMASRPMA